MSLPSPNRREQTVITLCLALVLAITFFLSWQRLRFDFRNRSVEIALPENQLMAYAAADPGALAALRRAGVTTMVREPYTLEHMLHYGLAEAWQPEADRMEIRLADERLTGNATVYLTGQLGLSSLQIRLRPNQYIVDVKLPAKQGRLDPGRYILEIPYGPMPDGFRRALHLPAGDWGLSSDLDQFIQALYSLKPEVVIPDWKGGVNAAAFFRSYLNTTWLHQPLLAVPETGLPPAGRRVLRLAKNRTCVRVHMLAAPGVGRLSSQYLRQQLVRAVRERGVRLLYVNALQAWTFSQTRGFLDHLNRDLHQAGFVASAPAEETVFGTSRLSQMLILLGVGALVFLFLWRAALWAVGATGLDQEVDRVLTIRLRPAQFRWLALSFTAGILIMHMEGPAGWGAKLGAFCLACLAPFLGLSSIDLQPAAAVKSAGIFRDFAVITVWNLAGGLAVSVLLYRPEYVQRLDGFSGASAAYLLPALGAAFYLFPQILDPDWWRPRFQRRTWLRTALGLGVIAGLLGLLWQATWAESRWFSLWEPGWRNGLEAWLGVQPRFNEFAVGHPLLLAGLAGLRRTGSKEVAWPRVCLWFGMIGQMSIIATFCEIHAPLAVSLLRVGHGLWLGGLLGGAAVLWLGRLRPAPLPG